jgi:NADH-quinone oxidoreductase subunit K
VPALTGQIFSLFNITVAAAEVAVGIAILINLYRNRGTTDVTDMDIMKR